MSVTKINLIKKVQEDQVEWGLGLAHQEILIQLEKELIYIDIYKIKEIIAFNVFIR